MMGKWGSGASGRYCSAHQSTAAIRDVDPLLYRDNLPFSLLKEVVADSSLH